MGILKTVLVPNIGDFKDIPVIEVLVKAGDTVQAGASLITLESDKATLEVPTPFAGVVTEINIKLGDKVSEGMPILSLAVMESKHNDHGAASQLRYEEDQRSLAPKFGYPTRALAECSIQLRLAYTELRSHLSLDHEALSALDDVWKGITSLTTFAMSKCAGNHPSLLEFSSLAKDLSRGLNPVPNDRKILPNSNPETQHAEAQPWRVQDDGESATTITMLYIPNAQPIRVRTLYKVISQSLGLSEILGEEINSRLSCTQHLWIFITAAKPIGAGFVVIVVRDLSNQALLTFVAEAGHVGDESWFGPTDEKDVQRLAHIFERGEHLQFEVYGDTSDIGGKPFLGFMLLGTPGFATIRRSLFDRDTN